MRTTLDIDDLLLEALMARSPGLSKTKAIEQYVKTDAYERVRALRGAFPAWSTTPLSSTVSTPNASSSSIAAGAGSHDRTVDRARRAYPADATTFSRCGATWRCTVPSASATSSAIERGSVLAG